MKTFVLMWNPAISNYKESDFNEACADGTYMLSWSIWDYKAVEIGDRFYMVRVGEGNTGIVMAGTIISEPYTDEDWSGRGRQVYYADLDIEYLSEFDHPFISTEQLMQDFPGFEWRHGHSGQVLPANIADKLEKSWLQYINAN